MKGVVIALIIIVLWSTSLVWLLNYTVNYTELKTYLFILIQTHLYTGIFITAHDAMHRTVSSNLKLNNFIGTLCAGLFAYNWFPFLIKKHHLHHKFPGTEEDPDFYKGNFFKWYYKFLKEYISIWQFLLMALTFNILKLFLPQANVVLFWMLPAILSTFQLFYFGTWLPHKGEHHPSNIHKARSQNKNHFVAFFTCYFFGYHLEHHSHPGTPWWRLYKRR